MLGEISRKFGNSGQADLPDKWVFRIRVQPLLKNIFLPFFKIMIIVTMSRLDKEGRIAVVTKRAAGCDGRESIVRRAMHLRTAKSCGSGAPGLAPSSSKMIDGRR